MAKAFASVAKSRRRMKPKVTGIVPCVFLFCVAIMAAASPGFAADRYVRASVDAAGALRILTSDGRAIVPPKEPEQVGFDNIAISPDGSAVGWVALFPNCCTSYPIPLKLVIYSNGKARTFTGTGLPVWRWQFTDGSKQVAFAQETVHGGLGVHYELRDIATGRKVADWSPMIGPDNQPLETQKPPSWASSLDAK